MLQVFVRRRWLELCDCLRLVFSGGEALPPTVMRAHFRRLPSVPLCTTSTVPPRSRIHATENVFREPVTATVVPIGRSARRTPRCTWWLPRPAAAGRRGRRAVARWARARPAAISAARRSPPNASCPLRSAATRVRASTAPATGRAGRRTGSWSSSDVSISRSSCAASGSSRARSRRPCPPPGGAGGRRGGARGPARRPAPGRLRARAECGAELRPPCDRHPPTACRTHMVPSARGPPGRPSA